MEKILPISLLATFHSTYFEAVMGKKKNKKKRLNARDEEKYL